MIGCRWAFYQWGWMCDGHGMFPAWPYVGTFWIGWVRVSIPDRHLLLSWKTPLAGCSRGLHCWSFHIVPEWLELVLPLCWSFWGPTTGLHARLCQMPSWSLWSCGTDHADVVSASFLFDSTIEDLSYCVPAWSKTCLFFCQQFLGLGLESVEDKFEHDIAQIAD